MSKLPNHGIFTRAAPRSTVSFLTSKHQPGQRHRSSSVAALVSASSPNNKTPSARASATPSLGPKRADKSVCHQDRDLTSVPEIDTSEAILCSLTNPSHLILPAAPSSHANFLTSLASSSQTETTPASATFTSTTSYSLTSSSSAPASSHFAFPASNPSLSVIRGVHASGGYHHHPNNHHHHHHPSSQRTSQSLYQHSRNLHFFNNPSIGSAGSGYGFLPPQPTYTSQTGSSKFATNFPFSHGLVADSVIDAFGTVHLGEIQASSSNVLGNGFSGGYQVVFPDSGSELGLHGDSPGPSARSPSPSDFGNGGQEGPSVQLPGPRAPSSGSGGSSFNNGGNHSSDGPSSASSTASPDSAFGAGSNNTGSNGSAGSNLGSGSSSSSSSGFSNPSTATTSALASYSGLKSYGQPPSASSSSSTPHPGLPPLWARAFSLPRNRRVSFTFDHGAYGIPKRHPWAVASSRKKGAGGNASRSRGMLAAAADFLTGPVSASPPAAKPKRLGSSEGNEGDGTKRKRGLNSSIRENGRIVHDRLQSVQVGEDAYFLRPDSLGVADGVGGWASRPGADPALFSRLLMHFCAVELGKYDGLTPQQLAADGGSLLSSWTSVDPVEVMHRAWERCVRASRREGILGSSTALIALLRGDELRIANLGDCVLLIIRAGELLFRSAEQQHSFNFPVQLGMMGHTAESVSLAADRTLAREGYLQSGAADDLEEDDAAEALGTSVNAQESASGKSLAGRMIGADAAKMAATSSRESGDHAASDGKAQTNEVEWDEPRRDAGRWTVKVQKGDIIVIGSDGLVDNLFDEDIVEEVLRFAPPPPRSNASSVEDDGSEEGSKPEEEYVLPPTFSPQLVSEALCSRAKAVSEDSRAVSSPFQQRAMEEGLHYVGGKHDDISVLVAVVGEGNSQWGSDGSEGDGEGAEGEGAEKGEKYLTFGGGVGQSQANNKSQHEKVAFFGF